MHMTQPLRIGLVGAGMVSRHHLIAWASLSDQARVVAIADPSADNAARRTGEFAIAQTYPNLEAMLAATELDAIDIAAPREMHAPLVRLAAKRGYSIQINQSVMGDISVAAPIIDEHGRAIAAVNISVPTTRWTKERAEAELVQHVHVAATSISKSKFKRYAA